MEKIEKSHSFQRGQVLASPSSVVSCRGAPTEPKRPTPPIPIDRSIECVREAMDGPAAHIGGAS